MHERKTCGRGRLSPVVAIALMMLALLTACIASAGAAMAEDAPDWQAADLLRDLFTRDGTPFITSGSAYIEPEQGLRVNGSGANLILNPSFENGLGGWTTRGDATAGYYSDAAHSGSQALTLTGGGPLDGIRAGTDIGGIPITEYTGDFYTFSVHLRTTDGVAENVMIFIEGDVAGMMSAGPFTVTSDWRRYSVAMPVGSNNSVLSAGVIPAVGGGAAQSLLVDSAQLENRPYSTTYFDGDQTGSAWTGPPHGSTSVRAAGHAYITDQDVALDLSGPFWFALDITLGFNSSDTLGSYPIGSMDFLNIGSINGTGYGMSDNEGVILDYYSVTGRLSLSKINSRGTAGYPIAPFSVGDELRAVCSYDPERGLDMWLLRGGTSEPIHVFDDSEAARQPSLVTKPWILSVSDCKAWSSYGDYQSNSLHRNLVVRQGRITTAMAAEYLADPKGFLDGCGKKPTLTLVTDRAYWNSFDDYEERLLSVDYTFSNSGQQPAFGVRVNSSANTNGVSLSVPTPLDIGAIPPGGENRMTLRYAIPQGVNSFRSTTFTGGLDACGFSHFYPHQPMST